MIVFTPLALNTRISAASAPRPGKAIVRAEMIAKPAISALAPTPTLRRMRRREGPCEASEGGGCRSREARDIGRLLGDEFKECGLALAGLRDAALDRRDDLPGVGDALAIAAQ